MSKNNRYSDQMSIARTLIIIGVTLIITCCAIKACNSISSKSTDSQPIGKIDGAELLKVETAPGLPEQIVEYSAFTVSFNRDMHVPNWVSWELLGEEVSGDNTRTNKFYQDSRVAGCPTTNDYRGSGFSRGHMAPAADMKWSADAMRESFSMANICPQLQVLNGGAWGKLEDKCRKWAQKDSAIIIIAGPVLSNPQPDEFIGDNQVAVPKAFFKVILSPWANPPRGIGFIMPNGRVDGGVQAAAVTIDSVEALTGHNFFTALPDSIQNLLESQVQFHKWDNK